MATTNAEESSASRKDDDVLSDTSSPSDSDGENTGDEAAAQKIEWLATTRAKRSTAGNRMKAMLANEEPAAEDSDLELLFAEDEDDAGFTDVENDASDVHMDSSSDDEDQDENADDLEGEKELERQAREKRNAQRKRKAQDAIPAKFRKKVRIEQPVPDSASVSSAAPQPQQQHKPRPKKKSERLSWLPTAADMPTRASERRTTKMSKEQLHQKMVKDEIRRKKQMEAMEKKAARLAAMKKPPMTQAERLAEAALVEKRNSKSLNRWEEAEKQREEERLRKIAALNSRKLDGPVVTFWSGIQELEEGQLKHVGKMVSIEEKAPRKKRQSAAATLAAQQLADAKAAEASKPPTPTTAENPETKASADTRVDSIPEVHGPAVKPEAPESSALDQTIPPPPPPPSAQAQGLASQESPPHPPLPATQEPPPPEPPAVPEAPTKISPEQPPEAKPEQGLAAPSPAQPPLSESTQPPPTASAPSVLAPPPMLGVQMPMMGMGIGLSAPPGTSNVLAPPNTTQPPSQSAVAQCDPVASAQAPMFEPAVAAPTTSASTPRPTPPTLSTYHPPQPTKGKAPAKGPDTPEQATPTEPPREGKVTRSCIILQNFDEEAIKDKQVQTQILFGRKMNRLAKPAHAALCVITNHPARYRDPKTGLPFYNAYAFKEIQRALRGDYRFSSVVGAYMGSGKHAARGVPDRFLDPTKPRSTPVTGPPEENKSKAVKQEDAGEKQPLSDITNEQNKTGAQFPVMDSRLEPALAPVPGATSVPGPTSTPTPALKQVQTQVPPVHTPSQVHTTVSGLGPVFAPIPGGISQPQPQARVPTQVPAQAQSPAPVAGAAFPPPASSQPQPRARIPVTNAVFAPAVPAHTQPQAQAHVPASAPPPIPPAPKQVHSPAPGSGPVFAPPLPGQPQVPTRPQATATTESPAITQGWSPAATTFTGATFAPPPGPGQPQPQPQPQPQVHPPRNGTTPAGSGPDSGHSTPGRAHSPVPGRPVSGGGGGPVFVPPVPAPAQSHSQLPHPQPPHQHQTTRPHPVPPPALPGSAEEAIASVRSNRLATPPVSQIHPGPTPGA